MDPSETIELLTASAPAGDLPPMPIDADLITDGNPVARGTVLMQTADKKVTAGIWTCEPGAFRWTYTWDEFFHLLEGAVTVITDDTTRHTLGPGDTAHFPVDLKTHWHIDRAVRKFFVLRTNEPFEL
jgi:hypothetical protein